MAKRGKVQKKALKDEVDRPIRVRKYKQFFLIVCEDEKCEPHYFKQFKDEMPERTMHISTIGTGRDQLGVVNKTIEEIKRFELEYNKEIDFAWAVFDKDDADRKATTINKFNQAYQLAIANNIKIALSNECFELWLLLHFTNVGTTILPRQDIYSELEKEVKKLDGFSDFEYNHGKIDIITVVSTKGNESEAISRAKNLHEFHKLKTNTPIQSNPSTNVYELVEELRAWITFYSYTP